MKKMLALLLALSLVFGVMPAFAAEETVFYTSDFAADPGAWFAKGEQTQLSVADGALMVSGRKRKTDAPVLTLALEPTMHYVVTAEVMQDAKKSIDFAMSIEHKKAGRSSYTRLADGSASRGEWVTLTGEWTAEAFDSYELSITTAGTQTVDFAVRNIKIMESNPNHVTRVVYEGPLPSLKELSAQWFDFGTCISQADTRNTARMKLVTEQYNIITPENELKPDSVLDLTASRRLAKQDDTAAAVHFSAALPILNYARDNGLKVHGHVLVWHSQTPEEFFHVGYDRSQPYVSREVMLARLENYIKGVFEYMDANYPGLIVSWDVANECVADGSSSLRSSNWTKVVGADFVARAFEYADRYAPDDVMLYYNDYSTPYEPKLTGIVNLLSSLVAEGHIDGYGFQSHYSSGDPSISAIQKAFDRISNLGLRLRVSELDITCTADTDITRAFQADRYADLMRLYLSYADKLDAVEVWGVCDGTSWIREKFPLYFDASLQPKPAFLSVADVFTEALKQGE